MLYKRSSFLTFLKEKYDCEIIPLDGGALKIKHGSAQSFMITNRKDQIDYEEVYMHYQKLWLPDVPGDADLERIE